MPESIGPIRFSDSVLRLLSAARLPVSDLESGSAVHWWGLGDAGGRLVGVVGVEPHGRFGLLRSLAVREDRRGTGAGTRLLEHAESAAAELGIDTLYLLTETAADWFAVRGYRHMRRERAPAAIASTAQFAGLCPASASLLARRIVGESAEDGRCEPPPPSPRHS